MAVAIDKISTITLPNYSGLGVAIEGLTAKQAALVLSTRNLSQAELEEVVIQNDLISKYGAEQLVKAGLLSTSSSLLVSEKTVSAEKLKESIIQSALNKEKAEEFIQTQLSIISDGEETASTIILNKALLDETVKRGVLTKEKAKEILSSFGAVNADKLEIGSKKGLAKATKELIKDRIRLSKFDISVIAGVTTLIAVLYKFSKVIKEVRDKAQELGDSYKETSSTIDEYKSKIEELYKVINDESSSIEDTTNARKSLLSVQDELIDKFGTEESVINNVTDAINGQTEALDKLSKVKWQEAKNDFTHGGFWNDVANFFQGTDNIERMLDEYGEQTIYFPWAEYAGSLTKITDDMVAQLENIGVNIKVSTNNLQGIRDFDSLTESIVGQRGISLSITGNADEIYNKILSLQNLINGDDSFGNLYKNIERHADSYKELTEKYKNFYDQYILQEKIFADDSQYTDTFKNITDAAQKYNDAFISGDKSEIKEAADEYADFVSTAMTTAIANGDSDVATYFENMYPTLKSIVNGWNFNVAFDANTNDLQGKVQNVLDELKDENDRSLTAEEILGLGESNAQYQALIAIAHTYNMTIEEMIELLKKRNLVSNLDYQGLVGLFGQDNIDKLSSEDLEIAYTIKNVGSMTFEQLQEKIQKTKEITSDEPLSFSSALSSESLSKFQSTIGSLKSSLTTLYNGDYSSTELISALTSINSAMADIGKADSINWEEITNVDDLDGIIDQITNDYVDTMLDSLGMAGTGFGDTIRNVIQEELKASRQLETYKNNVSDLQSAYSSLTDVIETYNANGYITFDQLTALLEMEPQYLSCLIDANGQLQLNEQAMADLAQLRLNEAKAQVVQQAITELNRLSEEKQTRAVKNNSTAYANNESAIRHWNNSLYTAMQNAGLAVPLFAQLSSALGGAVSDGVSDEDINQVLDNAYKQFKLIDDLESSLGSNLGNVLGKSSSSSSSTDDFKEQFDFFERRVKVLDDAVSLLRANLKNLTGSFAKNQLLDQSSNILEERVRNYSDAAKMYQQKALESLSMLDAETQSKIIHGSVSLQDYIGEDSKAVTQAMNDYQGWADKVADCTQELASLQTQLRQLELDKFNHIVQDFTDQFDLRDNTKGLIDKQISLFEEAGQLVGKAFYEEQISQTQKQLSLLENEKAQLVNQLNTALNSGRIQKGTEEWLEMVKTLSDVDGNILDCKKSIETFDNAIQNLHWEVFDRVQDTFGNLSDEISNLLGTMKNAEVATPDNQWTDEGLTQLGLYAQQYELATYRASQYANEIDQLNADYIKGNYSATEYADKLADLSSSQWKAVNAAESAKDSILDLNETRVSVVSDGIQKEIDAYKELIDSQTEALDTEKELHEYQNSIAEKSGNIAKMEKQLAAMQNDTTAATVAKRKQLEEQLAQTRADLEETQYQHSVETQKESLNQQYENYEDARNQEIESLEESLKDRETIIAVSMESVRQNTQIIADQITEIANQHGIKVSTALTNSWASGENAIASYGEVLSQQTSTFIGNIMAVETQIYQLQTDADITALSLANMFGATADNLVGQLNASYFAETNLLNMTNALQNSLVNTLQGEYNVSNIVNSLNAVTNAAQKAKEALRSTLQPISQPSRPDETTKSLPGMAAAVAAGNTGILKKYASGTRNITSNQLALTNESGQEFIYRTKDGSILTRLQPGDKVFNNVAVERLYQLGQGLIPADITPHIQFPQLNNIKKAEGTVNMNYDHLIEINGDVNDTNHFIKQISTVAEQAITNAVKTAEKTRKYGMF